MAVLRSALPDVERPTCGVCEGRGKRRVNGPLCPNCQGTGREPRRRGPRPPADVAWRIYDQLADLGEDLETWRFAWTEEGDQMRTSTRDQIKDVVTEGARLNLTVKEMADAIGISRQALDNIMRGDPTGRHRTRNQRVDYVAPPQEPVAEAAPTKNQLRKRLREISASYLLWSFAESPDADLNLESVRGEILELAREANKTGLSRTEILAAIDLPDREIRSLLYHGLKGVSQ